MEFVLLILAVSATTGAIGSWIANEKGRDRAEGFIFGFFLSIPGLIIEGLLPIKDEPARIPQTQAESSTGPRFSMVGEKSKARRAHTKSSVLHLR